MDRERFIKLVSVNERIVWVDRTKILWIEEVNDGNSKILFDGGEWFIVKGNPDGLIMNKIGHNL